MNGFIRYIYNYLNYKPEVGLISAAGSYILAIKGMMITDDGLKVIATISACAACLVSCLTAISWLIRSVMWCLKTWRYLRIRLKK